MKKQVVLGTIGGALAVLAASACAQSGFYGGVSIRDGAAASSGLVLGDQPLAWSRFGASVPDEGTNQSSHVFGGYRWNNDVAVEATFNTATTDPYALRPAPSGINVAPGLGLSMGEGASRSWNADVYTSWEMIHTLSLYGRLGYAQSDLRPLLSSPASQPPGGVNYGLGLRYDVTHSLGLRVEYARFGRFAGETPLSGSMPESDQVTVGVQFRF